MRDYLKYKQINDLQCKVKLLFGNEPSSNSKLTYIVTTYNRFDLLNRCIKSLLSQERKCEFSILVIDNNIETIENYRNFPNKYKFLKENNVIYYVNLINIGGARSANNGAFLAKTKHICFIHDDDIVHKNHFSELERLISENPNAKYISVGLHTIFLGNNQDDYFSLKDFKKRKLRKIVYSKLYYNYYCPMLGSLIDRKSFLEVGGIDTLSSMEDYIFTYKFCEKFSGYYANENLYGYTIFDNDSLNDNVWNGILVEKFFLRKYMKKKHKLFTIPNTVLLAKDIAYFESNYGIKKMSLNRQKIIFDTHTNHLLVTILVFVFKIVLSIRK